MTRIGPSTPPVVAQPLPAVAPGAPAPEVAAKPVHEAQAAKKGNLLKTLGGLFTAIPTVVGHVVNPNRLVNDPKLADPGDKGGLKVANYNVMLGCRRGVENVGDTLEKLDADVITLQEASKETTAALAKRLGMHYTYMGSRLNPRGKAILSRYPIQKAEDAPIEGDSLGERVKAYFRQVKGKLQAGGSWKAVLSIEPLEKRTILHARIKAGGRTIDVLDNHLALGYTAGNTRQLEHLAKLSKGLQAEGHTVIAAGDFNTNFQLAGQGKADAAGRIDTETDTAKEIKKRYKGVIGNVGDPANKAALDRLLGEMQSYWDAAPTRTALVDGRLMTPEQAKALLRAENPVPGSERYKKLLRAMDGVSHLAASKRFDNILASKDVKVASAHIDQTSTSSDHQAVATELRWK